MIDTSRFQFIADALHGRNGFRPKVVSDRLISPTYLIQYPREDDRKFARRNEVAWYANNLGAACGRFAGYLSRRAPQRDLGGNPLYEAVLDDCDWKGAAMDVFWSQFTIEAKARGSMLLLVDMPRETGASMADQMAERNVPYLAMIEPERVIPQSLVMDDHGRVAEVEISDGGQLVRGWSDRAWWAREGERIIEQGEHPLGVCPVLAFAEKTFPDEGEFAQIADLSKRLFNLRSELDEILRAQTFSLLTYQVPPEHPQSFNAADIAAQIGTHNMLVHSGQTPAFISPSEGPARIYLDVIAQVEEMLRRIGHVVEAPDKAESGVALTIRFQQLNSALSHWARRMEDLERNAWWLIRGWLGLSDPPMISWDDDYAITDISAELDMLASMQATGFAPATLRAKRQQIVSLDFSTSDDEDLAALLEAEEEAAHERTPSPVPPSQPTLEEEPEL